MSLRRQMHYDSLQLMLDSTCNTFGGFIMISLLMALLSGDTLSNSSTAEQTADRAKQIQQLQSDIVAAQAFQAQMQTNLQAASSLIALATERDSLQKQVESDQLVAKSNLTVAATVASTAPEAIPTDTSDLRKTTLLAEIKVLNEQLDRTRQLHQRQLRLPRERVTSKRAFYFIVRYGRIYPIHVLQGGARSLNTETIRWTASADGKVATPVRDAPPSLSVPPFALQLRDIPKETYAIHFLVYDDSFATFLAARQLPLAAGFDTGWEFFNAERPVIFSAGGEAPHAL